MSHITFKYQEILDRLGKPFPADDLAVFPFRVTKDKSKGIPAFYVDARAIRRRLDETCVWESKTEKVGGGEFMTIIRVLVETEGGNHLWIARNDGAMETIANDDPDTAFKGGISSSFRRAAVTFNCGQYLYDVGKAMQKTWLPLNDYRQFVRPPMIPAAFLPDGIGSAKPVFGGSVNADKPAKKSKPQSKKSSEPKKTKSEPEPEPSSEKSSPKLASDDIKRIMKAGAGKDRNAANAIVEKIRNGEYSVDEGVSELKAL